MTIGRVPHPLDIPLVPGAVAHVQIDDNARVVAAPAAPRTQGQPTLAIVGLLPVVAGGINAFTDATFRGATGVIAAVDLPPFLSWVAKIKSGTVQVSSEPAFAVGDGFEFAAGEGFEESEGSSVAGWYVREVSGVTPALVHILASVAT